VSNEVQCITFCQGMEASQYRYLENLRVYLKVLHNIEWICIKFQVFFLILFLFFAVPDLVKGHQMKIYNQHDKDVSERYNNISYLGC
jgi:hypothetical protein